MASLATIIPHSSPVEIIVVDNGSADGTLSTYVTAKAEFPKHNWRYFCDKTPGLLTGRHRGAMEAKGEVLAFLDDDIIITTTWLDALHEAFTDPQVVLAGGPVRPLFRAPPPAWLNGMWIEFEDQMHVLGELALIDFGEVIRSVDPLYVGGCNFSIRKSAFNQFRGFHPDLLPEPLLRFCGDGETGLALKLRQQDLTALYHPKMAVQHIIGSSRLTPKAFERKAFLQGISDSYSALRRSGVPEARNARWKACARKMKWALQRGHLLRNPSPTNMRFLTARARIAGHQFHQKEVLKDPELLRWVLKPNYLDYQLPAGWSRYLPLDQQSSVALDGGTPGVLPRTSHS